MKTPEAVAWLAFGLGFGIFIGILLASWWQVVRVFCERVVL